jgi:hypothetical protein
MTAPPWSGTDGILSRRGFMIRLDGFAFRVFLFMFSRFCFCRFKGALGRGPDASVIFPPSFFFTSFGFRRLRRTKANIPRQSLGMPRQETV